jgi:hypothetical protein
MVKVEMKHQAHVFFSSWMTFFRIWSKPFTPLMLKLNSNRPRTFVNSCPVKWIPPLNKWLLVVWCLDLLNSFILTILLFR